jgi:hypothetical protein
MDFGQYTEKQVFDAIAPRKGSGKCERCGKPTRTKTVFGTTICNDCLDKQLGKRRPGANRYW